MRLDYAIEPLLPREVAPVIEHARYTIGGERILSIKLALFRRRLIVDFIHSANASR